MFVIPDEILEELLCFNCHKYLSVKPVKVYPNRGIKCGRCCVSDDAGAVSCFGLIANEALFPCVNRFDGCNQLLTYQEVDLHEKICKSRQYDCPICVELSATSYDLYVHFKQAHPSSLLENSSELILDIVQEIYQSYLYRKGNLLFFIALQYIPSEQTFAFAASHLGDEEHCVKILQSFELYSLDSKIKYKSKKSACGSAAGGVVQWLQIKLVQEEFSKSVVVCRFSINAKEIEQLMALPSSVKKDFWVMGGFTMQKAATVSVGPKTENSIPFQGFDHPNKNIDPPILGGVTTSEQLESGSSLQFGTVVTTASDSTKSTNIFNAPIIHPSNLFENSLKKWTSRKLVADPKKVLRHKTSEGVGAKLQGENNSPTGVLSSSQGSNPHKWVKPTHSSESKTSNLEPSSSSTKSLFSNTNVTSSIFGKQTNNITSGLFGPTNNNTSSIFGQPKNIFFQQN